MEGKKQKTAQPEEALQLLSIKEASKRLGIGQWAI
jgi:uncharacterized small protein (DUF1192 family)